MNGSLIHTPRALGPARTQAPPLSTPWSAGQACARGCLPARVRVLLRRQLGVLSVYSGLEHPSEIHCTFMKKLQKKNHLAVTAIPSPGELTRAVGQAEPRLRV